MILKRILIRKLADDLAKPASLPKVVWHAPANSLELKEYSLYTDVAVQVAAESSSNKKPQVILRKERDGVDVESTTFDLDGRVFMQLSGTGFTLRRPAKRADSGTDTSCPELTLARSCKA